MRVPSGSLAPLAAPTWRLGETPWRPDAPPTAGIRVIVDNDFSGDPDDLFQLVHQVLSPGAEVRVVVASHLRPGDPVDMGPDTAANAERVVLDLFRRLGLVSTEVLVRGSALALGDDGAPRESGAVHAIIAEALREDPRPLYYLAGGGLTDLASAVLLEPRVAERLVLVWIGGAEHEGLAVAPPGAMPVEYNLLIDVRAAQVLFAEAALPIWQVPRNAYRQCLVSGAELRRRVAPRGELGAFLAEAIWHEQRVARAAGRDAGDSYCLGDSPLVLLTALRSTYGADATSSEWVERPTPAISSDGGYLAQEGAAARPMRVYSRLDVRLMTEDLFLVLEEFAAWHVDGAQPPSPG